MAEIKRGSAIGLGPRLAALHAGFTQMAFAPEIGVSGRMMAYSEGIDEVSDD